MHHLSEITAPTIRTAGVGQIGSAICRSPRRLTGSFGRRRPHDSRPGQGNSESSDGKQIVQNQLSNAAMSNRAVILAILAFVLATLGGSLWYSAQGPRYEGRTVAHWMATAGPNDSLRTNRAIRAMLSDLGTNALRPLMAMLDSKDSPWTKACRQIVQM